MSRSTPSISRDRDYIIATERETKEPSWYQELVANLDKQSVKGRGGKDDYSMYDQINAIVSDKGSKFSSVEEKVQSMVERTGLKKMLATVTTDAKQPLNTQAQLQMPMEEPANKQVQIFASIPELKTFIDNYIDARPGTSVDAVVLDALKINQIKQKLGSNADDLPLEVRRYISFKLGEATKDNAFTDDSQLGKVDTSVDKNVVDDPLAVCNPARDGSA